MKKAAGLAQRGARMCSFLSGSDEFRAGLTAQADLARVAVNHVAAAPCSKRRGSVRSKMLKAKSFGAERWTFLLAAVFISIQLFLTQGRR